MPPGVSALQCPVCQREFDPSVEGAERQFNVHVNKCVDSLWSDDSRSSSQQAQAMPSPSPPDSTKAVTAQVGPTSAPPAAEAELVVMLTQIMPDLTSTQARELLVAYQYQLEILVPMLLELQEEPTAVQHHPSSRSAPVQAQSSEPTFLRKSAVAEPTSSLVELVIYDLQPERSFAKTIGLGAFHSAVIIFGVEVSFGGSLDPRANKDAPGVWSTRRKYSAAPAVKARLLLGEVQWSLAELRSTLTEMGQTDWRVRDYHLLSKNCNHFTDTFLRRLGQRATKVTQEQFLDVSRRDSTKKHHNVPELTLPEDYLDDKKKPTAAEVFKLPSWVNRAAKLGDKVVPDFIFTKILEKLMPPVAEDQEDEPNTPTDPPVAVAAASSSSAAAPVIPAVPAAATETSTEAAVVLSIADVIGADPSDPVVRLHVLGVLRKCRGNADLAVQQLLQ